MITANDSKARSFTELRDILGYIENGGGSTVKIFQDDATRAWHVCVGNSCFYDESLQGAIQKAHQKHHELIEPRE